MVTICSLESRWVSKGGGGGGWTSSLVYFIIWYSKRQTYLEKRMKSVRQCVLEELIHCSFQFLYPGCKAFSYNFKDVL